MVTMTCICSTTQEPAILRFVLLINMIINQNYWPLFYSYLILIIGGVRRCCALTMLRRNTLICLIFDSFQQNGTVIFFIFQYFLLKLSGTYFCPKL